VQEWHLALQAPRKGLSSWASGKADCGDQPARLVRGSSATNHCHAAPALLTREYQSDDRRCSLTSATLPVLTPLDKNFHIRSPGTDPRRYSDALLTLSGPFTSGFALELILDPTP
jgi:hypothetical protein